MATLIYVLCLAPLLLALARPRFRPAVAYLVLSGLLVAAVVVLNPWLNKQTRDWADHPVIGKTLHRGTGANSEITYQVTRDDIVEVAGPVVWRFFSWGILEGGGASTPFKFFLRNTFKVSEATASRLDLSNPTPFMLLLWLLFLALASTLVPRKKLLVPEESRRSSDA